MRRFPFDYVLETPRLYLVACNIPLYQAIFDGDEAIADYLHVEVQPNWSEFGPDPTLSSYRQVQLDPQAFPWWMYLPIHRDDNRLLGACGYKGRPNAKGGVEIGYEIIPEYRNQGIATELAKALIDHAFMDNSVKFVQAHTLAHLNPSVSVLKKCGMEFVVELIDPDEGEIWQWRTLREDNLAKKYRIEE